MTIKKLGLMIGVILCTFQIIGCSPYGKLSKSQLVPYKIMNNAITEAREKKLGIIIMPTFQMNNIYNWNLKDGERQNTVKNFNKTRMIWRHESSVDNIFAVASQNGLALDDPRVSYLSLGNQNRLYLIFIVKPGLYGLIGSETVSPKATISPTGTVPVNKSKVIGQSFVKSEKMHDYYTEVRWSNAIYTQKAQSSWTCTLQHASGTCLSSTENKYNVDVVTRPAGYYEELDRNEITGLVYTSFLTQPFATVEVKPGEVILADSFFITGNNTTFENKSCIKSQDYIQCGIESFDAALIKTSLGQFKNDLMAKKQEDKYIKQHVFDTLNQAQYISLKISAKVDNSKKSKIGDIYTLK